MLGGSIATELNRPEITFSATLPPMTYTKIGRVVAFLTVAVGILAITGSFVVAPDLTDGFDRAAMRQTSHLMTQGAFLIFFGLALGILSEISSKMDREN